MIIVRYLIRETVKTQLAVLFVLFLIFFSQKFIRILASATDGGIPSAEILSLVALYMPSMATLMLPLSLYVAILITFGRLYAESEITVMNATGMGNKFLIYAALCLALITGSLAAFNALWLSPWATTQENRLLEEIESDSGLNLLVEGQMQSTPNGQAVIFVDDITNNGGLRKIFIAQPLSKDNLLPNVVVADQGSVTELADGRQLLKLKEGVRYEGIPSQLNYSVTEYQNYQVLIGQREVKQRYGGLETDSTLDLWRKSANSRYANAELQWRISMILSVPLMTLIVLPLSAVNPRSGRFAKLLPAVVVYLAYFLSISAAKTAIENGSLPPEIGLWSINIIVLLIGILLLNWDSLTMRQFKHRLRGAN